MPLELARRRLLVRRMRCTVDIPGRQSDCQQDAILPGLWRAARAGVTVMPPVCWLGLLIIALFGLALYWALYVDDGPGRTPLDDEIRDAERWGSDKRDRRL